MSMCPECGGEPQVTTQNDDTGEALYMCESGHLWPTENEEGG